MKQYKVLGIIVSVVVIITLGFMMIGQECPGWVFNSTPELVMYNGAKIHSVGTAVEVSKDWMVKGFLNLESKGGYRHFAHALIRDTVSVTNLDSTCIVVIIPDSTWQKKIGSSANAYFVNVYSNGKFILTADTAQTTDSGYKWIAAKP